MMFRRALLLAVTAALLTAATATAARPALPGGSSGSATARWANSPTDSSEFGFQGTLRFGDGSYSGSFWVSGQPQPVLTLGAGTTPVASCHITHARGVKVQSGLFQGDFLVAPTAAVLRCTGHLANGPDTTVTLVVAFTDGFYDTRFGTYNYYNGTYQG